MLATLTSGAVLGVDAFLVAVETEVTTGIPCFHAIGIPQLAAREIRERIHAALANSGYYLPPRRVTLNLSPGEVPKQASALDLPIAAAMLAAAGQMRPGERLARHLVVGELAMDGALRPVRGALPLALAARESGFEGIVLPEANAAEAAVVEGLDVRGAATLKAAVHFLEGTAELPPYARDPAAPAAAQDSDLDFADVLGQEAAKRGLEVAAAGAHNVLMLGPPGSGKTMLAQRLPGILPPMSPDEALEATKIHSVAGLLTQQRPFVAARPFRSPHFTISDAGLVGGGPHPRPGEAALAHHGVLFLDEFAEFRRNVLEALRQPAEERQITLVRGGLSLSYPSAFLLVAAMNPCPCGHLGGSLRSCTCTPEVVRRYQGRVAGPLLDRIDMHVEVAGVRYRSLADRNPGERSEAIRERVVRARAIQQERFAGRSGVCANAHMSSHDVRVHCSLASGADTLLREAITRLRLGARAYTRVLKIARTIADLDGGGEITPTHVSEAIQYRALDRGTGT